MDEEKKEEQKQQDKPKHTTEKKADKPEIKAQAEKPLKQTPAAPAQPVPHEKPKKPQKEKSKEAPVSPPPQPQAVDNEEKSDIDKELGTAHIKPTPQKKEPPAPVEKGSEGEVDVATEEECKPCGMMYYFKMSLAIVLAVLALLFLIEGYMRYQGTSLTNFFAAAEVEEELRDVDLGDLEINDDEE